MVRIYVRNPGVERKMTRWTTEGCQCFQGSLHAREESFLYKPKRVPLNEAFEFRLAQIKNGLSNVKDKFFKTLGL